MTEESGFRLHRRVIGEEEKRVLAAALSGHEFVNGNTCFTCGQLAVSAEVHWTQIAFKAGMEYTGVLPEER